MKNFKQILFISLIISGFAFPQVPDSVDGWFPTSEIAFNLSQISFTNWSQGGQNSLTWALIGTNGLIYKYGTWLKRSSLKLAYGRTKISGQESRVNDNEFFLETVISKNIGWVVDPYFSNSIRTPLAPGYLYSETEPKQQIVGFFDPGYVIQSLGFTYNYVPGLNLRAGFAVQETFTNKYRNYSDDPETPNELEAFRVETGLEAAADADYNLTEQFNVKSGLRLFTRFEDLDIWDVRWDNIITAKINNFINVNFNFLLVHEVKQSLKTQLKEALQLGIYYRLL